MILIVNAPMLIGKVDNVGGHACVLCPYHGHAFDEKGYLREIPADENRVRFESWLTVQYEALTCESARVLM